MVVHTTKAPHNLTVFTATCTIELLLLRMHRQQKTVNTERDFYELYLTLDGFVKSNITDHFGLKPTGALHRVVSIGVLASS